jgi:hypothetical protein
MSCAMQRRHDGEAVGGFKFIRVHEAAPQVKPGPASRPSSSNIDLAGVKSLRIALVSMG